MNPKLAIQLARNMGFRYVKYRLSHEWQKRNGALEKKHPIHPQKRTIIYLKQWREETPEFLFKDRHSLQLPELSEHELKQLKSDAEKILQGEILFFNHEWIKLGHDYDWLTNPDSGYTYPNNVHWSKIQDFNPENGDIKYVWEKSRFSYILTILRYDYYFQQDHSGFVFKEIASWIEANPINLGPNWKCSQEISLRCFNWLFALYFYKDSVHLHESLFQSMLQVFKWSLHHVYHHIDFSRIAVRNNHAITETLFLSLSNFLFPFIAKTKKYATEGRKYFEEEIAYQIYEDGTFLQFSMNYHRVVIQLLCLGIKISEIHQKPFSSKVYDRAYKSLDFLFQCLQKENGHLPNYGANDGALFFPLSQTDYRDYRSQLNALHIILTGKNLFDENRLKEDACWLNSQSTQCKNLPTLTQKNGPLEFKTGGYYLLRDGDTFTFLRCGNHKDRPSQADNLHLDIWIKGENVLRDAGSYKYNTDAEWVNYFMGTASHNTVMAENNSQMLKGGRFIWYYWTQAIAANWRETQENFIFEGEISAFTYLNSGAKHRRMVEKMKGKNIWIIQDEVINLDNHVKHQIFNTGEAVVNFSSDGSRSEGESFYSSCYGNKVSGKKISFSFDKTIKTTLTIEA